MLVVWVACEATEQVGLGHLSRCVAIAEELKQRKIIVCFNHFCNFDSFGAKFLHSSNFQSTCVCNSNPNLIIIDDYKIHNLDSIKLDPGVKRLQIVDDTSPAYLADGYIQASPIKNWQPANLEAPIFEFRNNPILRSNFDAKVVRSSEVSAPLKILVILGAASHFAEICSKLLSALSKVEAPRIEKIAIFNPKKFTIPEFEPHALTMLTDNLDLEKIYPEFNFVISAAGVTAWELTAIGIPGFVLGVSDNQQLQLNYLIENQIRIGVNYFNNNNFDYDLRFILNSMVDVERFTPFEKILANGRIEVTNWIIHCFLE